MLITQLKSVFASRSYIVQLQKEVGSSDEGWNCITTTVYVTILPAN